MLTWNVLMLVSVLGALAAAATAIYDKAMDKEHPAAFPVIIGLLIVYGILVAIGFAVRKPPMLEANTTDSANSDSAYSDSAYSDRFREGPVGLLTRPPTNLTRPRR